MTVTGAIATAEAQREANREKMRQYRAEHPERIRATARRAYAKRRELLSQPGNEEARQHATEQARAASRRYREAHPERERERHREVKRRQRSTPDGRQRSLEATRRWRETHPEQARQASTASRRRLDASDRTAVFDHYGQVCMCCGTTSQPTIDHINGDGRQHRQEAGRHLYRWLVMNGFPEGFQTLCRPCNRSKGDGPACRMDHAHG